MLFIYRTFRIVLVFILAVQDTHAQAVFTLQGALQKAVAANPILKTEKFNIAAAKADRITATLRPNPVLNNQSLQLIGNQYYAPATKWYNGQNQQWWWQLTRQFQTPALRSSKIAFADSSRVVAEKNYAETERNVLLEVASKWLELWTAQMRSGIIAAAKTNIDSLLLVNKYRYQKEVITQTDLLRTEQLASQYQLLYQIALQEVNVQRRQLAFLLGESQPVDIDTTGNFIFSRPLQIDTLLQQSLLFRSDIQAARSAIGAASANMRLQKALAFPQPEFGLIYNPQNTIPYFGIYATVELPFFSRNQGERVKSAVLKHQAEAQLNVLHSRLFTEVQTAYGTYLQQRHSAEKYRELIQQSQTIFDNVRYAYLRGGTTIIDLLEAQRSWLETRQQYYDAEQAYRQSFIQLLFATGLISQIAQ
jgi:outer membrane protein, heavy metal efflux system